MLVKNNSSKIVGIHETSILPGATGKVPDGYEKNPTVLRYIDNGTFSVIGSAKPVKREKAQKDSVEEAKKTDDIQGSGADSDADGAGAQNQQPDA